MLKVANGLKIDLAELVAVYRRQLRETPAPRRRRRRRPTPDAGGRDEPAT
jgi:hypothetical protein